MGQYFTVVNVDKQQFLNPHTFGAGLKLKELSTNTLLFTALAGLLANSNGQGGGDLQCGDPLIGSWAGDRIVFAGDYAADMEPPVPCASAYACTTHEVMLAPRFEDISQRLLVAICSDPHVREQVVAAINDPSFGFRKPSAELLAAVRQS